MSAWPYALTYTQLINQALALGVAEDEIRQLKDAFFVCQRLFDGFYRAQGVPAICHLTRSASIVLSENQPIRVVIATLLHAAYLHGGFEDGEYGKATERHRAELRQKVGADTESLIYEYQSFPWHSIESLRGHLELLHRYEQSKKEIIIMELTNDLEDYLDLGMAYRCDFPYRERITSYGDLEIELAERMQLKKVTEGLRQAFKEHLDNSVPLFLRGSELELYELPKHYDLRLGFLKRKKKQFGKKFKDILTGVRIF